MLLRIDGLGIPAQEKRLDRTPVHVGRDVLCDIVLESPFIDPLALRFECDETGQWRLVVLGNGCLLNHQRLDRGAENCLQVGDKIELPPVYCLSFRQDTAAKVAEFDGIDIEMAAHQTLLNDASEIIKKAESDPSAMGDLERTIERVLTDQGLRQPSGKSQVTVLAGQLLRHRVIDAASEKNRSSVEVHVAHWRRLATRNSEFEKQIATVVDEMYSRLHDAEETPLSDWLATEFPTVWNSMSHRFSEEVVWYMAMTYLKRQLKNLIFGFGPLEDLLEEPDVTDIMVNGADHVFFQRSGRTIESSGRRFVSEDSLLSVIQRIAGIANRRIDAATPIVDARLPDGSRVNAVIPPVATTGASLTIRRVPRRLAICDLVNGGMINARAVRFLVAAVKSGLRILVCGGAGSGKTTILRALAGEIAKFERIVVIEDTAELLLPHPNVVSLETRPPNSEGKGQITSSMLVSNNLRMNPDWTIVGECRGQDTAAMLEALNTGHKGMTTVHANSAAEVIIRLVTMLRTSGLPVDAIHQQIAAAFDLVVYVERQAGRRSVMEIAEVVQRGSDRPELKPLFIRETAAGLSPTGFLPSSIEHLIVSGGFNVEDLRLEELDYDNQCVE